MHQIKDTSNNSNTIALLVSVLVLALKYMHMHAVDIIYTHLSNDPVMVNIPCFPGISCVQGTPKLQSGPSVVLSTSDEVQVISSVFRRKTISTRITVLLEGKDAVMNGRKDRMNYIGSPSTRIVIHSSTLHIKANY